MPRCLMAKKWKAYPWPDREDDFDTLDEHPEEERSSLVVDESEENHLRQQQHQQQQQHHHQGEPHHHHHHIHQKRLPTSRSEPEDEEIDVVGDADGRTPPQTCWGPHSPTAGATAPSPPPLNASGALYYHGYTPETWIGHEEPPKYATLRSAAELAIEPSIIRSSTPAGSPSRDNEQHNHHHHQQQQQQQQQQGDNTAASSFPASSSTSSSSSLVSIPPAIPRKSLAMCFTSTGIALSLPPKKKDIYRPYSLQQSEIRIPAEEDLSAAQAILDLSASPAAPNHSVFIHTLGSSSTTSSTTSSNEICATPTSVIQSTPVSVLVPVISQNPAHQHDPSSLVQEDLACSNGQQDPQSPATAENGNKTVAYTYEAFFVSDGRSKKRSASVNAAAAVPEKEATQPTDRPKYTCTECGKQYATSSNLSRHKQTHRSLDSQSAKKCIHCGKAYVSMPALAMHVLTHKLAHSCGVCGKMFSRPWLLQGHLRSHTGEKPYGCAHCGKAFADRSNLRAHMQTHSSDKNYECSRCHKTFALKSYLNKHLESACLRDDDPGTGAPPGSAAPSSAGSGNRL